MIFSFVLKLVEKLINESLPPPPSVKNQRTPHNVDLTNNFFTVHVFGLNFQPTRFLCSSHLFCIFLFHVLLAYSAAYCAYCILFRSSQFFLHTFCILLCLLHTCLLFPVPCILLWPRYWLPARLAPPTFSAPSQTTNNANGKCVGQYAYEDEEDGNTQQI